ncbi:flavin reductase family protein [Mycobacterium sp.]|uniref:flavin reductase family protein n=1 Tax=Mycobacterium sp. TaxID=1785 RepID=UPI003A8636AF
MTIHSSHPFHPPEGSKDLFRRLRGRLAAPVTILAADSASGPVGLTVSSILLADGPAPVLVALVDPDSDLGEYLELDRRFTMNVLQASDDYLAEAFAGLAPAPGGPFTMGDWEPSSAGPRLAGRASVAVTVSEIGSCGWAKQIVGAITDIELADGPALIHLRGRYHAAD